MTNDKTASPLLPQQGGEQTVLIAELRAHAADPYRTIKSFNDVLNKAAGEIERLVAAAGEAKPGHGLSDVDLDVLLKACGKPDEIAGDPVTQQMRVRELLHWFKRFTEGHANPKWATEHACELAYYIATNGQFRHIDANALKQAGYLEGAAISEKDRDMLVRHGIIAAPASLGEAKAAQWTTMPAGSQKALHQAKDVLLGPIGDGASRRAAVKAIEEALSQAAKAVAPEVHKSVELADCENCGAQVIVPVDIPLISKQIQDLLACNGGLYQVLLDAQNGIDSPATAGMANKAICAIDKIHAAWRDAAPVAQALPVAAETTKVLTDSLIADIYQSTTNQPLRPQDRALAISFAHAIERYLSKPVEMDRDAFEAWIKSFVDSVYGVPHDMSRIENEFGDSYTDVFTTGAWCAWQHIFRQPTLAKDMQRLDYLQEKGATVEITFGLEANWQFRVAGIYATTDSNVRKAIDIAITVMQEGKTL
jgi:hypothetical protein